MFIILVATGYLADREHSYGQDIYVAFLCAGALLILAVFAWPVAEVALDDHKFYYISRSMLPWFTRTTAYPIHALEYIHHRKHFGGYVQIGGRTKKKFSCTLEIRFKNGKIRKHKLSHEEEVLTIVQRTNEIIKKRQDD